MYSALDYVCVAALIVSGPAMLTLKFIRKRPVPWWLVVLSVVVLTTGLSIVRDYIGPLAHAERFEACARNAPVDDTVSPNAAVPVFPDSCGPFFYHVWTPPIYLKWIPGLIILALSLPFYGLAVWLKSSRARDAAA